MWAFCPDVCIGTMCVLGACRGRRGNHSPWTGVTERDNWRPGAENRAWVFWRATRALNHRGNFLAPERFFFFFFKWSALDSYLSLTEIKSGTWRQAWFHHLYNQPGARVSGPTEGTACRLAHPQLALNPLSGASAQEWHRPQNWAILHQWTILAVPHKPVWSRLFLNWGSLLRWLWWYQAES